MEDNKNLNSPEAPDETAGSAPAAEAGESNQAAASAHSGHAVEAGGSSQAAASTGAGQAEENPGAGQARILARAGEAFDAVEAGRALHEAGLKDPAKVEPTDQGFIFADPGESRATFVADDETLRSSAEAPSAPDSRKQPTGEPLPMSPPALDLTEAPDPDIPWRARPLAPGAEPLPMGVLRECGAGRRELTIYDTDPGLFGPGDSWLYEGEDEEGEPTELVLGVKFREYGSVYFFKAGKEKIRPGGKVLVETEQGLSLAEVISARKMRLPLPKIQTAEGDELEIKPIKGLPGPEDIAAAADNKILASGARLFCKECIRERKLDMKLVDVEVLHDRSKIIFYFTAPTRIDFRELVKDLVRNYRTRIELRQIGVRHETQMLGALGNCGMSCCCRRYLRRFAPVTIKMAKEQNLFLNPAKLSGICGRLLCCLANEQENYEEFHRNCPKVGKKYQTTQGVMRVLRANLFRQSIVALNESGEEEEFLLDSWHALEPVRLESQHKDGRPEGRADAPASGQRPVLQNGVSESELESLEDGGAHGEKARQDRNRRDKRQGRERNGGEHGRNDRRPRGQNRPEGEGSARSGAERGHRHEGERGSRQQAESRAPRDHNSHSHQDVERRSRPGGERGSRPEGENRGSRQDRAEREHSGGQRPQQERQPGSQRARHERTQPENGRSQNDGDYSGGDTRAQAHEQDDRYRSGNGGQRDERGQHARQDGPNRPEGEARPERGQALDGEARRETAEASQVKPGPDTAPGKAAPDAPKAGKPDAEADNSIFGLPGSKFRK